jgi:hypothetical protein
MNSPLRRGAALPLTVLVAGFAVWCDLPGGQVVKLNGTATTSGTCIGACVADPGSGPVDCTVQDQVETLPIESFDNYPGTFGASAQDLFTYTDGTAPIYYTDYLGRQAGGNTCYPSASGSCNFEPPVAKPSAMPPIGNCKPPADDGFSPGILHLYGGPFLAWGGGAGMSMTKMNGRDPQSGYGGPFGNQGTNIAIDPNAPKAVCCTSGAILTGSAPGSVSECVPTPNAKFAAICPPTTAEFAVSIAAVDVSAYEGVSFWARRGPNGQAGLRVMVGDKYVDDDLNYLAQRQQAATGEPQPLYCSRNRECACRNFQACQPYSAETLANTLNTSTMVNFPAPPGSILGSAQDNTQLSFCGLPTGLYLVSVCASQLFNCVGLNGGPSSCCERTNCDQPYPAFPCDQLPDAGKFAGAAGAGIPGDPQFYGRPCTPYTWANGIGSSYCFDPATDPPPAPPTEICGDFWMETVTLSTDWTFYMVPFTALRQQGWAKKSEFFDLHSVSNVRFSWDIGWIDYWINELSFYRHTSAPATQ